MITLTEFGIQSSVTDFKVGMPYHFVVTNTGSAVMVEANELTPGKTASFDHTFTEPAFAGRLDLACHAPGHYEAGMMLSITVE